MDLIDYNTVFSDWLSITFPASTCPYDEILQIFSQSGPLVEQFSGRDEIRYKIGDSGSCKILSKDHYINFSISGSTLRSIESKGLQRDFHLTLGRSASNISRLDASIDYPLPGAPVIASFKQRFPDSEIAFSKKLRKIIYQTDLVNGQETGTAYFQKKNYRGHVKIKAYDKAHQLNEAMYEACGVRPFPSRFRYEISIGRGASLADFADPTRVFWHYMPKSILRPPEGLLIAPWKPTERVSLDDAVQKHTTSIEELRYYLENSITLRQLLSKVSSVHGGERELLKLVSRECDLLSRRDAATLER